MEDRHCRDHAYFNPGCESCQRARAAFLPYRNVDPHPEPASRSFRSSIGPANVTPIVDIGVKEAAAYGVADGITQGIIDLLFDR